jgi:hypothetical protein
VQGHLLAGGIQIGLVAAGFRHAGSGVVGNDKLRAATQELEAAHMAADPTGHALIHGSFGGGVVAGVQHGHEQLRRMRLTRGRIVDGDGASSPVHEQLLARPMLLAQHRIAIPLPALVAMTETAVTIAILMRRPVLLLQQLQGSVLVALQLLVNAGKIGQSLGSVLGGDGIGGKQPSLQLRLRHTFGKRPA